MQSDTLLEFGELRIPARIPGAPRATPGGLLLPPGPVTLLQPFGSGSRFYRHGLHSWCLTAWVDLACPPEPIQPPERRVTRDPAYVLSPHYVSSGVGAVEGPDGHVLLLGALGTGARVESDGQVIHGFYEAGADSPSPGWFLAHDRERQVFGRYAEHLAERFGLRERGPAPRLWCSWYGLYRNISEPVLAEVVDDLEGLPFDVFQVDDGWQAGIGDWEANAGFPSGMRDMAARACAARLRAGLWLAPLIVSPSSRLFREHPDWSVTDDKGAPLVAGRNWGDVFYALDTTREDVQDWLRRLVRTVRGWGYDYLKLDFLYAAALPGRRRREVHPEAAYREALAVMCEAAGDAYILVCGAPVIASLGLAHGIRVGPDVAPFWDNKDRTVHLRDPSGPGAQNALRTSLNRLWLAPLIDTDPDIVYFRSRYNLLTPVQRRCLKNLALAAGFKATSDPPAWLDPDERRELAAFLRHDARVERTGRYRFRIDDADADFEPALNVGFDLSLMG